MFSIHYVISRENDDPIDRVTFGGENLSDAIAYARSRVKATNAKILTDPVRPHPVGFLIFDPADRELLHREYQDRDISRGPRIIPPTSQAS
jgi:hypothetical protein